LRLERPRPPLTKGKIAAERERENSGDVLEAGETKTTSY
jgi:hypothetical protein